MLESLRVVSIVGARPQFVKLAPVLKVFECPRAEPDVMIQNVTLHTGQHYDSKMSRVFFDELELPRADINLSVGSGLQGWQTGKMLAGIEASLVANRPDMAIVFGDTNSTLAGTLAAAKLHIPVVHVEAGLRSFDRLMPEEVNRITSDHLSDLLLAPTPAAMHNLEAEGLADRAVWTGDVMLDAIVAAVKIAEQRSRVLDRFRLSPDGYGLVTVHRAENTDKESRLRSIVTALESVAANHLPLVFPLHPRTRARLAEVLPAWSPPEGLQLVDPVGYLDMLLLTKHSKLILTDSGGLQKEAFFMDRPCVTLRRQTEWLETVEAGMNILADVDQEAIRKAVDHWLSDNPSSGEQSTLEDGKELFGGGEAAERVRMAIVDFWRSHERRQGMRDEVAAQSSTNPRSS